VGIARTKLKLGSQLSSETSTLQPPTLKKPEPNSSKGKGFFQQFANEKKNSELTSPAPVSRGNNSNSSPEGTQLSNL
jgi:hypothetical protein